MSSITLPDDVHSQNDGESSEALKSDVRLFLEYVASLKLTCVLFLLGMILVFIGSLAQARKDVWLVVGEYFRTYLAFIDIADLFPPAMFPGAIDTDWDAKFGSLRYIPFPGGWTIGWIMLVNLVTAHCLRFRIRVDGARRAAGTGILAIGMGLTWLVVWTGNQQTGVESGNTVLSADSIWYLMLGVLGFASAIPLAFAFLKSSTSKGERILMGSIGFTLGAVLAYFLVRGEEAQLNLSSMRILWQLLKGTACAMVMLVGCNILFEKRGGVVLLHIGVALLMFSELQVGWFAKENLLALQEGEKLSFMRDVRERELAVVHRKGNEETVVAIPQQLLEEAIEADGDRLVDHEGLPFLIRVDSFLRNSQLRPLLPNEDKTSTGLGTFARAVSIDPVSGMDDTHDMSTVQFALLDRSTGDELQTILCSQSVSEMRRVPIAEQATVDNQDFQFYLRFQRNYKDYEVELLDVSRTNYVGSATPKDYRSKIVIKDKESGTTNEFTVWMNNPLRYQGETFYQSGYNELPDGTEMTTLSVVRNTGWMLPYIACMIVAVGMFAQFGRTLNRYLARLTGRSTDEAVDFAKTKISANAPELPRGIRKAADPKPSDKTKPAGKSTWTVLLPVIVVFLSAGYLLSGARSPKENPEAMNLYGFAQLPVAWKGRAQPVDSFARTQLLITSHSSTFKGELSAAELDFPETREKLIERIQKYWPTVKAEDLDGFQGEYKDWIAKVARLTSSGEASVEERLRDVMIARMPAVRWFLDVVARPELAARHRVIKIEDDQVLSQLGLETRKGLVYSMEEVGRKLEELQPINAKGIQKQMRKEDHKLTQLERRVVDLFQTVGRISSLEKIFDVQETESLVDALVQAWWVLDALGRSPALMATPTGINLEERSWETLIAASSIRNVRSELKAAGIGSREELIAYLETELPDKLASREAVRASLDEYLKILYSELARTVDGEDAVAAEVKSRATSAAHRVSDPFAQSILNLIGEAPQGASADEIIASVDDDKLKNFGDQQISSVVFRVFQTLQAKQDSRLPAIRLRLQSEGSDESEVTRKVNIELVSIMLDDLDKRVGGLLYEDAQIFDKGTESLTGILAAWGNGDVKEFNAEIKDYREYLAANDLPYMDPDGIRFEAFFNFYDPFYKAICLYLPVLVLSFFSWIVFSLPLRRTAFWLMGLTFVLHTLALYARMEISGRPPVTNLYSSAIFIGWAVVGASFFVERILKNGIGNILGASVGMGTLMIAHYLARDEGDTLGVMQAVLDTTFWLATHVVCITLGYAATFLAGALGMAYCVLSIIGRKDSEKDMASLGKIVYGVLCFAIFFSLVGTVLGGLWADDSWGRFWGWDPKENGAMLIVMWNAVILHARWDKMIRDYGTAVLAMFGNIVTAWSWFGVNELKAGLHTYGFTEGRLFALAMFMLVQAVIIGGCLIPVIGRKANDRVDPV